jgi:hypothetical protein
MGGEAPSNLATPPTTDGPDLLGTWTIKEWRGKRHSYSGTLVIDKQRGPMDFEGAIHARCISPRCQASVVALVRIRVVGSSVRILTTCIQSFQTNTGFGGRWYADGFNLKLDGKTMSGGGLDAGNQPDTTVVLVKQ